MNPGAGADPSRPRASQDTLPLMRRVAALMFVVGGFTALSGAWMLPATPEAQQTQVAVAVALIATGLLVVVVPRPSRLALEVAAWWGIFVLSVLIARSNPIGMSPLFYLWPVVFLAYFSSLRVVIATYGWMVVCVGIGLALNATHDLKVDTFTGTVSAVGVMAALIATMTRQQARLRGELALAAETDPLTGLLNRRSFNPHLDVLIADAVARRRRLAVIMIDLDHFKRLNDDHGHLAGDQALLRVAETLRDQSREDDLVSRFGGEEFAVALPGADMPHARAYVERVASALRAADVSPEVEVMFSAGITVLGDNAADADLLLRRADEALYAAKGAGRCRYASWETDGIVVGRPFDRSSGQAIGS